MIDKKGRLQAYIYRGGGDNVLPPAKICTINYIQIDVPDLYHNMNQSKKKNKRNDSKLGIFIKIICYYFIRICFFTILIRGSGAIFSRYGSETPNQMIVYIITQIYYKLNGPHKRNKEIKK